MRFTMEEVNSAAGPAGESDVDLGKTRIRHGGTITGMPNIAALLKSEISRVARKEVRAETSSLKKTANAYRSDIAALKRRAHALEQQVRSLSKLSAKLAPMAENEVASEARRFSAKSLASQRRRLGLSAADFGLLVGASSQSIYNWEEGKVRPRAKHLAAIAAIRTLGRKEAATHLESQREAG
jgi:DNA-binding transcriptional regulator YiaG